MSIHTIDQPTTSGESLRGLPGRIKLALADRALKKEVALQTRHIEDLRSTSLSATVTNNAELMHAFTAVRETAELTQVDIETIAHTAESALEHSAEHLFKDLKSAEEQGGTKISIGISVVLDALKAWDIARTDTTHDLAVVALNNFHGGAQVNLVGAFNAAKESSSPFDDELDKINAPKKAS